MSDQYHPEPPEQDGSDWDGIWPEPQNPDQDLARPTALYPDEFPTEHLPPPVRDFVDELVATYQVPAALPALTCLAGLAILSGPRARIRQRPDFTEPLTLYTVVALPPGSLKSPIYRPIRRPLQAIERAQMRQFETNREMLLGEMDAHLQTLEGEAAERFKKRIKLVERLAPSRLFVQNATPEAIEQLAAVNGGIANMLDSEGTAIGNIVGRYNNGRPNLEYTLAAHDCDSYVLDRVGGGHTYVDRTCMSVGLATQPEVLYELHNPVTKMRERGLLGRLVCVAPKPVDERNVYDVPILSQQATEGWENTLQAIARLPVPPIHDPLWQYGPDAGEPGPDHEPPVIRLSEEAMALHLECENRMNRLRHAEQGRLAYMGDWISKHYGRILRISGLLHLAQGLTPAHPVSGVTMQHALAIGDWMLHAAEVVYGHWHNPEQTVESEQITAVRDWWLRRECPQSFTPRQVMRSLAGRRWVNQVEDVIRPIRALARCGWWREMDSGETSGRTIFMVNPRLGAYLGVWPEGGGNG